MFTMESSIPFVFQYTAVITGNTTVIAAGCVGEQYSMAQCIPYSFSSDGTTTKTQCCSSDRCNSGMNIVYICI